MVQQISNPFDDFANKEDKEKVVPVNQGILSDPFEDFGVIKPQAPLVPVTKPTSSLEEDFSYVKPSTSLTIKQATDDPVRVSKVRDYMVARNGTEFQDMPAEDVMDAFVSHMRWVNTNEVSTAGEARAVYSADDNTKQKFGEAYKVYDELGSMFSNGDLLEGTWDYGTAILASPSTYAGGIVGRAASKVATKAAQKAVMVEITNATTRLVTKGMTKEAAVQARKEVISAATRHNLKIAIPVAIATDTAVGVGQNMLYQDIMMETGAQEDFNYWENAASALGGLVGGGVAYLPEMTRGISKLGGAGEKLTTARKARAANAAKNAAPEFKKMVDKIVVDWRAAAARGETIDPKLQVRNNSVDLFFDVDNENSFVRILQRAGADIDFSDRGTFSRQLTEFMMALPDDAKKSLDETLAPLGMTFGEVSDIFSFVMSEAGKDFSAASTAKKFMQNYANISVAKRNAQQGVVSGALKEAEEEAADAQVLAYTTNVWKRLLVSHPGTTMANVKGWGFSMAGRTLAELVHGGILGTAGLAKKLAGSTTADYTLAQSSALFKSQWFMAKTLVDPFTSVEAFSELLSRAPKKIQKKSLQSFFGGVDDGTAANFGLSPDGFVVKNTERLADAAADISLVKVQDIYTKTFSGLKQLDIEARSKFGVGIDELLNTGRAHEVTDEMWDNTLDAMMRDTFSQDYTREGPLRGFAKTVESISNAPGLGFIMPFGRFMNNTVAFTLAYSPVGLLPLASKAYRKSATSMDIGQKVSKAVVGTTVLGYALVNEKQKMSEGLQWYEERNGQGEIENVSTMFPQSLYNLMGRIAAISSEGGGVPKDLMNELIRQLGPLEALGNITESTAITDLIKYFGQTAEDSGERNAFLDIIKYAASSISGTILSGFTRPLDPFNDIAGAVLDAKGVVSDVSTDKKQAEGIDSVLMGFSRYTNNIFSLLLGKEGKDGKLLYGKPSMSATQEGPRQDPNPIAGIFGTKIEPRRTNIDRVLGMVNLPPFRADSFTTGVPEYDAFMNDTVYATLERKATGLINSPTFKKASPAAKLDMVNAIIKDARYEILDGLEHGYVSDPNAKLVNERRKLMVYDQSLRAEAKNALNIPTDDRKLNLFQIQLIRDWIEVEKKTRKSFVGQQ